MRLTSLCNPIFIAQCHCFAEVSSFHCSYGSILPLPSRNNKPWRATHSLLSLLCLLPPWAPEQTALWRRCVREWGTQDYRLTPSQLCCFTPIRNKALQGQPTDAFTCQRRKKLYMSPLLSSTNLSPITF